MLFLILKDASYSPNIIPQTSIILTAYLLCFGCQAMECWWKEQHKSVTIIDSFYGVSSRSCLSSRQPLYSPLKCHKAVVSLIFLLLKISNNLTFLPLILSESISSSLCYNLNFAENSFPVLPAQLNNFLYVCSGSLEKRSQDCELL